MTYYDGGIMDTCNEQHVDGWFCTEPVDHPRGEHVAEGIFFEEYARWPLTDPE